MRNEFIKQKISALEEPYISMLKNSLLDAFTKHNNFFKSTGKKMF